MSRRPVVVALGAVDADLVAGVLGDGVEFVARPGPEELLWRGSASAPLSEKSSRDVAELQRVATAIVKHFPRATAATVAAVSLSALRAVPPSMSWRTEH